MSTDIASLAIKADTTDIKRARADLGDLSSQGAKTEKDVKGVEKSLKDVSAQAKITSGIVSQLRGAFAGIGFTLIAKDVLDTNRAMEGLRAQLKAIEGTVQGAEKDFDFITKFAKDTPFEIQGLTDTFVKLKNFGITPTTEVMNALTNQAAKLGGSQETLSGITLALGQAFSKGKLQAQDMNQLIERGVPVYQLLAEVTGKNSSELQEMSEKGELGADTISKLITKMGELASGSNAAAMDTLNGKISNLSDAWHNFEDTLLNDKSEGILKSIVDSMATILNELSNQFGNTLENQIFRAKDSLAEFQALPAPVQSIANTVSGFFDSSNGSQKLPKKKDILAERNAEVDRLLGLQQDQTITRNSIDAIAQTEDFYSQAVDSSLKPGKKTKTGGGRTGKSDAQREAEQAAREYQREKESAIQASQAFVDQLEKENDLVGKSAKEKQIYDLDQIGITLQKKGANQEYIDQVLTAGMQEIDINEKLIQQQKEKEGGAELAKQVKEYATAIADANAQTAEELALFGKTDAQKQLALENLRIERDLKKELQVINESIATQEAKSSAIQVATNAAKTAKLAAQGNVLIEQNHKEAEEVQKIWDNAAKNIQSSLANFLFDPFKSGLDGMFNDFANLLRRIAAEQLAAQIMKGFTGENGLFSSLSSGASLFGKAGDAFAGDGALLSKGNTTGLLDGIIGGVSKLGGLFSFASGSPFIPRDGLAMVHRGERVVTAGDNANSGNQRAMNITVNVQSGTPDNVRRAAGQGAREALSVMNSAQRYR